MDGSTQQTIPGTNTSISGRKEKDGTEKVITLQPLRVRLKHLASLNDSLDAARSNLNAAVKAVAEQTGLMSSVVRKLIKARADDKIEDERRKADQLAMVFAEIGGDEHPERQSTLDSLNTGAARPTTKGNGSKEAAPIGAGDPPQEDPLAGTDLDKLSEHARDAATKSPAVKPPRPGAH